MRSWFYKDGKGKIFEDGVCPEGWSDSPTGKAAVKKKVVRKKVVKKKVTENKE